MKNIINFLIILGLVISLISCGSVTQKSNEPLADNIVEEQPIVQELPKLLIKTTTVKNVGDKTDESTSVKEFTEAYFEMDLTEYLDTEKGFKAQKTLNKNVTTEGYSVVFTEIIDEKGAVKDFKSTTDFLNFMDSKGYELVDKKYSSSKTGYTFKRK